MERPKYRSECELEVREYECDLQGVVNNANYQHYLEHARHKWLEAVGLDFAALHKEGTDLVVVRIEIDYRHPLRGRDRFVVCSNFHRESRLKIVCDQDIYRLPDFLPIAQAKVVATVLQNGRPAIPQVIAEKLDELRS